MKEKFIGGSVLSIADYKVAPFFFAFAFEKVAVDSKVEIPERILQFNFDFKAKVSETYKLLTQADGFSLKEFIDSKVGGPETNPVKEVKEGYPDSSAAASVGKAWNSVTDWMTDLVVGGSGKVKIHGVTASMNCLGPLLLARHTGVGDLELCMPGEQSQSEDYKKLVPFGGVPGLEDGSWSMGESGAILRYIAREYAEDLYPKDPKQRARIDWAIDRFTSGMYNDCVATIYVAMGFAEAPEKEEDLKAAGEKASKGLDEFAKVFLPDTQKFVGGDSLSIADFKIAPFFYAYAHPRLTDKCGVTVPERITKFNTDFAEACKAWTVFQEAEGGFSVGEILTKKTEAEAEPTEAQPLTDTERAMQDAMAEEAQKTVVSPDDQGPTIDNTSAPCCGCLY